MKFVLIGTGKTGKYVTELLPPEEVLAAYNSKNPPQLDVLKKADVIIVFVGGAAMVSLIPLLLEAGRPVVSGGTAVEWPQDLDENLQKRGIPWIVGTNFSIGCNLLFHLVQSLADALPIWPEAKVSIQETHHQNKKDTPSGTAKQLASFFQATPKILSKREGDALGEHTLSVTTPQEALHLQHHVYDRSIYAKGAIWAAQELIWQPHLQGVIAFNTLVKKLLQETPEHVAHPLDCPHHPLS